MWIPLLVMAAAVSLEPFRIGMTVALLNRPHPLRQLTAFLAGGFAMGLLVGLLVLFALRPALGADRGALPRVQIAVGAVLLGYAAVLVLSSLRARPADRSPGRVWSALADRSRRLLADGAPWTAGVAGLGIALPSVDYLAALALIAAAEPTPGVRLAALVLFNVVAFALVELPLLCHLVAPRRTRAVLAAVHGWVRRQGRRGVALLLAVVGAVLLGVGLAGPV